MPAIETLPEIESVFPFLNRDEKLGMHQALKKIRERTGLVTHVDLYLRSAGSDSCPDIQQTPPRPGRSDCAPAVTPLGKDER